MSNDANGGVIGYDVKVDLGALRRELKDTDSTVDKSTKETGAKMDRNLREAADRTESRFEGLRTAVGTALKGIGLAVGVAGIASINMAGTFEQSLNVLQSVTGGTQAQMQQLGETARSLGKDVNLPGISAADAAGAMTELAKAGLGVNDVMAASKGVLSLAKAGNLAVGDAATIASQALNAFKLKGKEASRVADILSAGANSSAASVEGMALGLQQSAAVASQFGVKLEDTVTALALFANRGITGSDAGTSLKTMLIALARPTGEASKLMQKLGIHAFDAKGQFVGLENLAGGLQKGLKGLTQEQQNAALATIFGTDAFRAAAFLADSAGQSYRDMANSVTKVGAATDLAAAQNSGFKGALDNMKSTLETIGIDLGTKVLPPLTDFLRVLADKLPPAIDWVIANGETLAISLGILATAFAAIKVAAFVSDIKKGGLALDLIMGKSNAAGIRLIRDGAKAGMGWVVGAVKAAAAWVAQFTVMVARSIATAVVFVAQGLAAAAVWIAQAVATGAAWVAQFIAMQAKAVWAGIEMQSPALAAGLTWIAQAVASSAAWVANFAVMVAKGAVSGLAMAGHGITAAASWIVQPVIAAAAWVTNLAQIVARGVATAAGMAVSAVKAGAAWVVSAARVTAAWLLTSIKLIPLMTGVAIGSIANAVMAGAAWVASAAATTAAWIVANIAILGVVGLVIAAVAAAAFLIIKNWDSIKNFAISAWNTIKDAIATAFGWVKDNWPLLLAIITGPFGIAALLIIKNFDTIKSAVGSTIDWFRNVPGMILGALGNLGSILYNSGRDLINGLINGAGSLLSQLGNFFLDKVPSWIRDPFKKALGIHSPSKVFAGFGQNITQGLVDGINGSRGMLKATMSDMSGLVSGFSPALSPSFAGNSFGSATLGSVASIPSDAAPAPNTSNPGTVQIVNNNQITNGVTVDQVARAQARELRRL